MSNIMKMIRFTAAILLSVFLLAAGVQGSVPVGDGGDTESGKDLPLSDSLLYPTVGIAYPEVFSCIVDGHDNAVVSKVTLDGYPVMKVTPNRKTEYTGVISLDNFSFRSKATVDLEIYKYISIVYTYEGGVSERSKPSG